MKEHDIEKYLTARVKALGGEVRKVQWVGRVGAPDRLAMLPVPRGLGYGAGNTLWIELKAPGEKPRSSQLREHERMRAMGQVVVVIDSIEGIEELLK